MLLETLNLTKKAFVKKVNYQLTDNFFSLDDIQSLTHRQVKKIVKTIAKIERIKLNRKEIKEIAIFLVSNLETPTKAVSKLWSFTKDFIKKPAKIVKRIFTIFLLFIQKHFIEGRFELMRN